MISKKNKIFITLFLCFLLLFSNFFCLVNVVNAQVKEDSGVLEDLSKDKNFNIFNYPEVEKDYSIKVIHLAEGESGAVYIYTYQPSGTRKMLTAKSINLCTKDFEHFYTADEEKNNNSPLFINYPLELLDCVGTLFKYKIKKEVAGTVVDYNYKEDVNFQTDGKFDKTLTRNYEISTIFRRFIPDVDTAVDSEAVNTIKGLEVGKCFSIKTLQDGSNKTISNMIDVVTITNKFVGFIRYESGWFIFDNTVDAWFVSFSTDKVIESLLEVELYYNLTTDVVQKMYPYGELWRVMINWLFDASLGEHTSKDSCHQVICHDDEGAYGGGWFYNETSFPRIISANNFLSTEGGLLNKTAKDKISNHQWVCRFLETPYAAGGYNEKSTVSNLGIFRLKFETDGVVYNLGAVDDLSTPDDKPDGNRDGSCKDINWNKILMLIALVLLLVFFAPILPFIFSILLTLLSLPFKLIGVIINKIKKGGDSNGKKT